MGDWGMRSLFTHIGDLGAVAPTSCGPEIACAPLADNLSFDRV